MKHVFLLVFFCIVSQNLFSQEYQVAGFDNFRELHIVLSIEKKGAEITAIAEIENQQDYDMYVPLFYINLIDCYEDGKFYLTNNNFHITNQKGKIAVYLGTYEKRGEPPIEQCVLLKKNEKIQIVLDNLERYYKLPRYKTLTFVYQSPLGVSNAVTIKLREHDGGAGRGSATVPGTFALTNLLLKNKAANYHKIP
jgi:hypothetical protein